MQSVYSCKVLWFLCFSQLCSCEINSQQHIWCAVNWTKCGFTMNSKRAAEKIASFFFSVALIVAIKSIRIASKWLWWTDTDLPSSEAARCALTKGDEVDTEDEDTTHKERGGLAEVPGAVLQQKQGNDVGGDLDGGWQEGVEVGVTVQVGSVEDQGVVADGNDEPAEFGSLEFVTWDGPVSGLAEWMSNYAPEKRTEQGHTEGVAVPQDDQEAVFLLLLGQCFIHLKLQELQESDGRERSRFQLFLVDCTPFWMRSKHQTTPVDWGWNPRKTLREWERLGTYLSLAEDGLWRLDPVLLGSVPQDRLNLLHPALGQQPSRRLR